MTYKSVDQIKAELLKDELAYIDAIETLVKEFNYQPKDAEALVEQWQDGD